MRAFTISEAVKSTKKDYNDILCQVRNHVVTLISNTDTISLISLITLQKNQMNGDNPIRTGRA